MSVGEMSVGQSITVEDLERDPYPIYKRLRDEEPISWVESVGLWLVTRWDDVMHVDENPDVFTAETEPSTLNRTFGKNLLGSEGSYHRRIRSIIEPAFRPGAVRPYIEEVIAPIANELIDGFQGSGHVELVHTFCEPLSVRVLKRVLGLGELPDDTLRRWFADLATGAANFEGDPEKQRIADAASAEVNETVGKLLERLEGESDDSILSRMLHSEVDGERLTPEEINANLKVMIVGGMQEPGDAVGIGLWALLSHSEQAEQVKADPGLIKPAVEEGLRWHSPVGTSTRQLTQEATLGGVKLEEGALIAAVVASANRDERHWDSPDDYNLHRKGAHLAFATGSHHCVGAWLARATARTSFRILLERLPNLRLADDRPIELSGWEFRRPLHLDVVWDA
ncbi:MAG TPA: cytochrome P450 [Actinomycetota bacterium]|jgi:cytochrome P450